MVSARQPEVVAMSVKAPTGAGRPPDPVPIAESMGWSAPGVRVLVAGIVMLLAGVVWQGKDTAQALYAGDDFIQFVPIQTETAVRHIASSYPYTSGPDGGLSLRDNADEITQRLSDEIAARIRADRRGSG